MNCKNCGNKLTNGTFCIRCGTDNNEQGNDNQEPIVIEGEKETGGEKIIKAYKKWLKFVAILGIIFIIMNIFNFVCKATSKEVCESELCGLRCLPPFYFTTLYVLICVIEATVVITPFILFIYFHKERKKNKKNYTDN